MSRTWRGYGSRPRSWRRCAPISQAILDHIDLLKEVDVSDIAPTAQVTDLFNVMREDAVRPSLPREDVLANAPDQRDGMFRVKAIFEE